ncbi:MAG TPA: hypothetical protein VMX13_04815 [Sedimentisphaerales bacterium]|nr:hypothetical protein [Sedimentisphaerales bacterium]
MIILLCIDFLGILLSFLVHLCLLLDFSLPSGRIAIVLSIGIVAVLGARLVITKELRQGEDWFWDKGLKGVGPLWLKVVISLIITYGIVNCIFALRGMFSVLSVKMTVEDSAIASRKLFIGVFSLIMACYAIEFLLLYLYTILKEAQLKKFKSEGAVR